MERSQPTLLTAPRARHGVRSTAAIVITVCAACGIGTEPIGEPLLDAIEVHAILDPARSAQQVLVERVHAAGATSSSSASAPFDPLDPISSRGGVPVTDAQVVLSSDAGDSVVLSETRRSDGALTGVYVGHNLNGVDGAAPDGPAFRLVPGRRYVLEVRVVGNSPASVNGSTQVPGTAASVLVRADTEMMDATGQPATLHWPRVPGARAYLLTVTHAAGVFTAVLPDTTAIVDGTLRDPGHGLAPVFRPGFQQSLSIAAIDSDYYDWVRVERVNSAELKTHLSGGLGVFGSSLALVARAIVVTTSDTTAPSGHWVASDSLAARSDGLPAWFDSYRGDEHLGVLRLSGRYADVSDPGLAHGLLGEMSTDSVHLALLNDWVAADTVRTISGTIDARRVTIELSNGRDRATYTRAYRRAK